MELKSVFEIVKADRYSKEGCEAIEAAQTEDKTYKTGEISQATGLQKQPDGSWAPPKSTKYGKVTTNKNGEVGIQQHGKSTTGSTKIKAGTLVKVKVNGGREGTVKSVNGDIVTVEMPARGTSPARIDQYYKSDLEATESLTPDPQLAKEIANNNHFEEQKEAAKKAAKEEELRRQRAEGEANAEAYRKRYEAEHPAAGSTEEIGRFYTKFDDAQSAYDAGRQTFPEGGYTIFKTPSGQFKVVDDPKTKQRMTAAGYEVEVDVPEGTKPPKSPAPKRESVSAGRMQKDLDGNFWSRPEDFKEDITSRGWDVEEMNNEYAVISNEAGSQYEVRFDDHSDDGDLTVRTFKPLMIDEDDDDGPEDAAPETKDELVYTAQSVNGPRERLTGDTKIKVRK